MRIPQERRFDVAQFEQDKQVYNYWFRRQFGVSEDDDTAEKVSATIYAAVRLELSEKQRNYFTKYYFEGLTMPEISKLFGVDRATVSRTIARARKKLERVLKYIDPKLMQLFEQQDNPKKTRHNLPGKQRFKPHKN